MFLSPLETHLQSRFLTKNASFRSFSNLKGLGKSAWLARAAEQETLKKPWEGSMALRQDAGGGAGGGWGAPLYFSHMLLGIQQ